LGSLLWHWLPSGEFSFPPEFDQYEPTSGPIGDWLLLLSSEFCHESPKSCIEEWSESGVPGLLILSGQVF
jgi:hypothetical protein